jgi:Tol biopolymer transport system component
MFQVGLTKIFSLYVVFLGFTLLTTCHPDLNTSQNNEPTLTAIEATEILATSHIEVSATPENTTASVIVSATVTSPTVTTLLPTATPSNIPTPEVTSTRTSFSGWLVFSSRRQDDNEDGSINDQDGVHLFSLNIATQQLTQLTFGIHNDLHPAWSPDRSQVAFVSNRDGNFELYVMNANGSEIKRLTNTSEDETKPRWSSDGTQIIYVQVKTVEAGSQEKRLYLISVTGNDMQQLTDGPEDDDPDWSSDGRYIAFTRIEKHSALGGSYLVGTVCLLDMLKNQVFKLTPTEYIDGTYYDPNWLPRNDYFLSMRQGPGDVTSPDNVEIFELKWDDGQPTLSRVSGITGTDTYVWGLNGDWLIAVVYNYDFVFSSVNLFTQGWASIWEQGELISNDNFYVDFPDWAP